MKPETRKIRDESFGKVSGQSFALVLRFRIFIIRETDMTSAEAHARKRLKMKAFSETTATCYPEPHSEDGFSVVFFGNRAVKSTRAVGPVVAETTVTLAIRIQGLSVLDVATPRTNPASPIRLRQTLRFRFFFFSCCMSCLDLVILPGDMSHVKAETVFWKLLTGRGRK